MRIPGLILCALALANTRAAHRTNLWTLDIPGRPAPPQTELEWQYATLLNDLRDRDRICCYDVSVTQCYALEALVPGEGYYDRVRVLDSLEGAR